MSDPLFRPAAMYDILQKIAIDWRRGDGGNVEVSLWVLRVLEAAYDDADLEGQKFQALIREFVSTHRQEIDAVYQAYPLGQVDLLDHPEAIAIYERLTNAPQRLREAWRASDLPLEFLEDMGRAFAIPT